MLLPEVTPRLDAFGLPAADVERAKQAASRQLREAIQHRYLCPPTLDAFPQTPEGVELRALVEVHGVSLAAFALSQHDGGRARKVDTEHTKALEWLADVKKGKTDLGAVLQRRGASTSPVRQLVTIQGEAPSLDPRFWGPVFIE